MKKRLIAFSATVALLTACGGETTEQVMEKHSVYYLNVDKGTANVHITIPASFFYKFN